MKARIDKSGNLQPPDTLAEGKSRLEQLEHEIYRIEKQLAAPERRERFPTPGAYESWKAGAKRALRYLQDEHKQLTGWIERNPEQSLLREAYDLLRFLRVDGALDPDEEEFVAKLDAHFTK